jgi:nicotinamidase-related amidase
MEVGIEPTVRHATDLAYLPIVIEDACGAGNAEAAERSLASLRYAGNVLFSDSVAFAAALRRS